MSPIGWAVRPLKRYFDFAGRAPRAEFWWYVLAVLVVTIGAFMSEYWLGIAPMLWLYGPVTLILLAGTFVPTLAVQVRRLHDTGRSGLWLLILWAPYVAYAYFTFEMVSDISRGELPDMEMASLVMLIGMVTFAASLLLLGFLMNGGTRGPNRYGSDPYHSDAHAPVE